MRSLRRRHGHARSKFKSGDRVVFTWAGPHHRKTAIVEHVRKDGALIIHFDTDPPGVILVVQPYEVAASVSR